MEIPTLETPSLTWRDADDDLGLLYGTLLHHKALVHRLLAEMFPNASGRSHGKVYCVSVRLALCFDLL